MDFTGIYCPITTPFVGQKVATDKLVENLEKWNATDLAGYVILGSTGEAVYLTKSEKLEIVKSARVHVSGNKKLIVGTGHESTVETIEFTKQVAELGVDAILVLTPCYYKPHTGEEHFYNHFTAVADNSPLPVILYNVPKFTNVNMTLSLVERLASHPNIVAIKDSTNKMSQLIELLKLESSNFNVLIGNDTLFLPGLHMGARGAVLALSNVAAQTCVAIFNLYNDGMYAEAKTLYFKIIPLAKALTSKYGIPAIKAALDMLGFYGGPPRRPLLSIDENQKTEIHQLMEKADLL
jgi:4-hydroxy-2-oxoglutarate aldolase